MTKDLLGLKDLSKEQIEAILDRAVEMKKAFLGRQRLSDLSGRCVVTLFYENSTRTRVSFEQAAKQLSAGTTSVSASTSSVQKGESLLDTALTLQATGADIIVIRAPASGAPHYLADKIKAGVVNAGDGINEHPTQALLDIFTAREKLGSLKGARVAIVGDIKHSRVARSNVYGMTKLGAEVVVCAPNTLVTSTYSALGCKVYGDIREAVRGANVVMPLRLQLERQGSGLFPSADEYATYYGVSSRILSLADKNVVLMHPAPINRGVEVTSEAADGERSVINAQVTNGVAVRMAVLAMAAGRL